MSWPFLSKDVVGGVGGPLYVLLVRLPSSLFSAVLESVDEVDESIKYIS